MRDSERKIIHILHLSRRVRKFFDWGSAVRISKLSVNLSFLARYHYHFRLASTTVPSCFHDRPVLLPLPCLYDRRSTVHLQSTYRPSYHYRHLIYRYGPFVCNRRLCNGTRRDGNGRMDGRWTVGKIFKLSFKNAVIL